MHTITTRTPCPTRILPLLFVALCVQAVPSGRAHAATVSDLRSPVVREAAPAPVLPARADLLVIDWVDAKAARIAIGGVTYALTGLPARIVLDGGEVVSSIGYLKAGMRVRIATSPDTAGRPRLVEIRVEG